MRELTTQTGIVVKCSKTAIEFFQNAQSVDFFSVLEIIATKQAHIEKCRKRLKQEAKP